MARSIDNADDIIDSRDVIARIEELQEQAQDALEAAAEKHFGCSYGDLSEGQAAECQAYLGGMLGALDDDEQEELRALLALAAQCEGSVSDWEHGAGLIRDSYFRTYAKELADDIGAINSDATWPNNCIDWERAARELQVDYTCVDFDGITYWVRS